MAEPLPNDIRESVAISGVDSVAGQPASLANLTYANTIANVNLSQQNTLANQQAINQVGLATLAKAVDLVADLSPMEAVATVKLDTGNDIAEQLADLKAVLNGFSPNPGGGSGGGSGGGGSNSGPKVTTNPSGGTNITLTDADLPTEISVQGG